jgi:hypothetical protein
VVLRKNDGTNGCCSTVKPNSENEPNATQALHAAKEKNGLQNTSDWPPELRTEPGSWT